jgi:hypothetical protein
MRNITGSPVEREDFFDRPKDIVRLERELANGANILLSAPRRVGKTSLVLRLCERWQAAGKTAVFINVEGCGDELAFAEKLVGELRRAGLHPDGLQTIAMAFQKVRRALGGMKFGAGIDVELGEVENPDQGTLARAMESIFHRIESEQKPVLIALDEMPELLLALAKQEKGAERVDRFLHWLRSLRQTFRQRIHWIFLGSIGLDNFVDGRQLRKTINDLTPFSIDALDDQEADCFLERLGQDNHLPLAPELRQAILQRVGWPLPHHLQIVFHALADSGAATTDVGAIQVAVETLLRPENLGQFDTWRQRLDEQFNLETARMAKDILRTCCQTAAGRSRSQLLTALMTTRSQADPGVIEEQLAGLLQVLQRDGYLLEQSGIYAFRSFLLREFWHRREVL